MSETSESKNTSAATFGDRVLAFNASLHMRATLPDGIKAMNPFLGNDCAKMATKAFYRKYYNDNKQRHIILGINPGRFGAGLTGVPFTDPKRLSQCCHIDASACPPANEPSSAFIYEMIAAYGGPDLFYASWYINSICPLGFVREQGNGRWKNYNYYDEPALEEAVRPFIISTLKEQMALGIDDSACVCLGTGKNAAYLKKLNAAHKFFGKILPVEHPRFVLQYRYGRRAEYIEKYLQTFKALSA